MEPVTSAIGAAAGVRLAPGTSDLASLFRDGRVIAGEVLETFAGGSVVLGIAGQRVPAQSHVELELGQRFLATVETSAGEIVLRLASDESPELSPLIRALRLVVGREFASGSILDALRSIVAPERASSPALAILSADLDSFAFSPGSGGEALGALVLRSGLRYESALLASADRDASSTWLRAAVADEVAARWSEAVGASIPDADVPALRSAIAKLLAGGPALADVSAVFDWLRRAVHERARDPSIARVRASLERALSHAEGDSANSEPIGLLRWLFGATPDDAVRSLVREVAQRALARDLKPRLLAALRELPEGPAREQVQSALASLETDQLMNVARRRFEQAWHFSVPVPDGDRFASARVVHLPNRDRERESRPSAGDSQRLMLGVDFSRLGPVQADLLLREHDLLVRLTVERPETAAAIRALVDSWRVELAVAGRAVHLAVMESTGVDAPLHTVASDVRFLADNHLMDVSA